MRLNKILLLLSLFTSIGLYAVDGPTIKNMFNGNIKVQLLDSNEKVLESQELSYYSSVTMIRCRSGNLLVVMWGEYEKDGRPKAVGSIMKDCSKRLLFTSDKNIVLEKEMNLNKLVPK
ncbi:MAG TPA: hypothetical protein PK079_26235 [Leptospiraceae bacterium]|nr:hypothetical protein [Leptospiraceae bacterium]HMZ67489.1 hypothetical protein [Leptospiraceae bacterium]HNC59798.1 hypothetical protein [Leptospiraceae bacterium]HNE11627.1 hypothetical protein [Leptospiraceae bacterium]HNE56689.1 hypothetical protein [Leptospiraceae bacterium]